MKSEYDGSTLDLLLQALDTVWSPGGEAIKLQKELNIGSLEESSVAAERAGYEVCHADLPEKVSGFATNIEGKPHIILNRAKSRLNLQYTLPHELGHHVLHLNPSRDAVQPGFPDMGAMEFQAHVFAATWVFGLGNERQRLEVFAENQESRVAVVVCFILTMALLVVAVIAWVCSKLSSTQPLVLSKAK